MPTPERFLDPSTAEATSRVAREASRETYIARRGPVLRVDFPQADTARDIAHGLGQLPDGYVIVESDAGITREPGNDWRTHDIAFLRSDSDNAHATLFFYLLSEAPR